MDAAARLAIYLESHPEIIGKVVDFNPYADKLYHFDFTAANKELNPDTFSDTTKFDRWITQKLSDNNCKYGIGGYMEHRTIYARSKHFDTEDEPRRLHLGVDIWSAAGTPVYSPLAGKVHSFQNNNNFGDYGPAIILEHNLDGLTLYSLYGHLSLKSLDGLYIGKPINHNEQIATLGNMEENGHWPPHLHFQLMFDMQGKRGDYPGVCKFSEKAIYQKNIPDPQLLLRFPAAVND
ncbi:peptidoglycan DD-metalloendopeptidase family protein [Mucilaginibacter sp. L3T2-6]|uniref:peptidoglycan DD-metalloendopeptidase family protein n=1 Tax=Mucilaginibacter sp. L3T2-6 TaxID=3062491 RepID=UPI002676AEF1|nr:peptidoglycan DD-metalloendopeptidase family protein [Mucilaginibacter sp. L3T2-6]MDO3641987.1 peptidoglycan DD-metalloendopeptidase family protein [Mucilaginibacter sp. L3T2-6]MDV6214335.1 peptidoglycan DD-metalloendopeptidase family protein [Mucilaginibacter sp. L3T2-6]